MPVNRLYSTEGEASSKEGFVAGLSGYAWYVVEHPYKGGGEMTQWREMVIDMDATTYDIYIQTKDLNGIVPDTYVSNLGELNSNFATDIKTLSGHSYFMLVSSADVSALTAGWEV